MSVLRCAQVMKGKREMWGEGVRDNERSKRQR
jgi:hypothetical protein